MQQTLPRRKLQMGKVAKERNIFAGSPVLTAEEFGLTPHRFEQIVKSNKNITVKRNGLAWETTFDEFTDRGEALGVAKSWNDGFKKAKTGSVMGVVKGNISGGFFGNDKVVYQLFSGKPGGLNTKTTSRPSSKSRSSRASRRTSGDITPSQALRRIDRTLDDAGVR